MKDLQSLRVLVQLGSVLRGASAAYRAHVDPLKTSSTVIRSNDSVVFQRPTPIYEEA